MIQERRRQFRNFLIFSLRQQIRFKCLLDIYLFLSVIFDEMFSLIWFDNWSYYLYLNIYRYYY